MEYWYNIGINYCMYRFVYLVQIGWEINKMIDWIYCDDALPETECSMTPGLSMPVMVTYLSYYDKTEPITSNHTAAYNFENDKWYWSDGYDIKRCDVEIIAWRELPEPAPVERSK